jgi:hypothetical protein
MTRQQLKELDSSTYGQALSLFLIHYGIHDRVNWRRDNVKDTSSYAFR